VRAATGKRESFTSLSFKFEVLSNVSKELALHGKFTSLEDRSSVENTDTTAAKLQKHVLS
jgi:hypothetical protein